VERAPYPFEVGIMERFSRGGKFVASPKGEWVRGYLLTFREDYPYSMWREYTQFAGFLGINPGTYMSFKTYIWILKGLGLIRLVRRERVVRGFRKSFYAITPGMENSPLWRSPMQTRYPSTDWKIKPYEIKRALRARYRAKAL
jgi:hypothetical protein